MRNPDPACEQATPSANTSSANTPSANVDASEIAKFNAAAAVWWEPEGEMKPLHLMNPLRLDYILEKSGGLFEKNVLDVGCGGGLLSEAMAREGAKVTGLDMGAEPLEVARLHALESGVNINYIQQTVEQHALTHAGQYDALCCLELLEHVPDPQSVVLACARLLKPGGHIFFSTLNRTFKAWLMVIVGAEHLLRLLPKGTHDAKKFIKPAELISWLDHTPLRVRHITGIHYNPLTQRFRLAPDVSVNYLLHARAPDTPRR